MARLRVLNCMLAQTVRQYGPHPTSDLLGVDYFYDLPADTEFPRRLGPLELFVRFLVSGPLVGRVRLSITRLHLDGTDRDRVYWKMSDLPAVPNPGLVVIDHGFKLRNVVVPGEARYAVRVSRKVGRRWDGTRRWRILAADHLDVRRAT